MQPKHLYLFSGLGADKRAFQLLELSGFHCHHVEWIEPLSGESLASYASRLIKQIVHPNPVLIGVSFGGIMAIEVAKQIKTEKILVISSAKTSAEIPVYYQVMGKLRLNKIVDVSRFTSLDRINNWLFGLNEDADKVLLSNILQDTDPRFINWAVGCLVNWKNDTVPENLKHIHGTHDKILPIGFVRPDDKIPGGGHFMIVNRAKEISEWIRRELADEHIQ